MPSKSNNLNDIQRGSRTQAQQTNKQQKLLNTAHAQSAITPAAAAANESQPSPVSTCGNSSGSQLPWLIAVARRDRVATMNPQSLFASHAGALLQRHVLLPRRVTQQPQAPRGTTSLSQLQIPTTGLCWKKRFGQCPHSAARTTAVTPAQTTKRH